MEVRTALRISVCGPRDTVPDRVLRLCVGSRSPTANPAGWRDLWKLSPLSPVPDGVAVPGLADVRSKTVENAWQFLKVWAKPGHWMREEAMSAFDSNVAIRCPRGKGASAIGHYWARQVNYWIMCRHAGEFTCPHILNYLGVRKGLR